MNMGKKYLKFSIVTVSLNSVDYIEEAIQSVLAQNYPKFEHIVIDGGSTDGTIDILRKYDHLIWISERDDGIVYAVNKGLRMMTGDIHGCLHADNIYLPGSFNFINHYFQSYPDVDMVYGNCNYIDVKGNVVGEIKAKPFKLKRLILSGGSYIPHPSTFVRCRVFGEIGLMDTRFPTSFDREMWIRIGKRYKVSYISRVLSCIRMDSKSTTAFHPYIAMEENKFITDLHWNGNSIERFLMSLYWRLRRVLYVQFKRNRIIEKAIRAEKEA